MTSTIQFGKTMAAYESAIFLVTICLAGIAAGIGSLIGLDHSTTVMLAELPKAEVDAIVSVLDDNRLRMFSLVGALGGAVISICLFPLKGGLKAMAARLTVSVISGTFFAPVFVFAPALIDMSSWVSVTDRTLALSGLVALFSWGVLQEIVPLGGRLFHAVMRWVFRIPDDHPLPNETKDQTGGEQKPERSGERSAGSSRRRNDNGDRW